MADWFFNIGQTIASHTPEVGTRELASWAVTTDKLLTTVEVHTAAPYYSGQTLNLTNCKIELETTSVTRIVNPAKAWMPRCKIRLDALKLLDLGIILKNLSPKDGKKMKLSRKMY